MQGFAVLQVIGEVFADLPQDARRIAFPHSTEPAGGTADLGQHQVQDRRVLRGAQQRRLEAR